MRLHWRHPLILACLLAVLTYLFLESRDLDRDSRLQVLALLQQLKLHDAELNRDVVMARAGLSPSYDALMRDRQSMLQDLAQLETASRGGSSGAAPIVEKPAQSIHAGVREKLIQVEHFKTTNALVRNSLMYLTYSVALLEADAELQRVKASDSAHLQHILLRFIETLDSDASREIETELNRLRKATSGSSLPILVAHGQIALDFLPQTESLVNQILAAPTTQLAIALESDMLKYSSQVESRAQLFRYGTYFFSLVLMGHLLHYFVLLRSTARFLEESNAGLQLETVERAQAELKLISSEERYRSISEFANEAIVTIDGAGRIASWNSGASEVFGYRPEEVLNKELHILIPKRLQTGPIKSFSDWSRLARPNGPQKTIETTALRRSGEEFPIELSCSGWTSAQGSFESGIMRDLSERQRIEAVARQRELQLIHANRMTALGTLVSGVSHEINNPTQFILMNAQVLGTSMNDAIAYLDLYAQQHGSFSIGGLPYSEMRNSLPGLINDIQDGARRIERIANGLKDYGRPRPENKDAEFELNSLVKSAVKLLEYHIKQKTQHFTLRLSEQALPAKGDGSQIEQVIVNLLVNSLEALANTAKAVRISSGLDLERKRVWIKVEDQGHGIAAAEMERICEPFFTTKSDQGGTGLGLAISAALVQAHGGSLRFKSELNVGTCAIISLPHHP